MHAYLSSDAQELEDAQSCSRDVHAQKMPGNCSADALGDAWETIWRCSEDAQKMLGRCLGDAWEMLGRCLGDNWEILGRCSEDSWEMLGNSSKWKRSGIIWRLL